MHAARLCVQPSSERPLNDGTINECLWLVLIHMLMCTIVRTVVVRDDTESVVFDIL